MDRRFQSSRLTLANRIHQLHCCNKLAMARHACRPEQAVNEPTLGDHTLDPFFYKHALTKHLGTQRSWHGDHNEQHTCPDRNWNLWSGGSCCGNGQPWTTWEWTQRSLRTILLPDSMPHPRSKTCGVVLRMDCTPYTSSVCQQNSSSRHHQPWVTTTPTRLRRKKIAFKRMKSSSSQRDKETYNLVKEPISAGMLIAPTSKKCSTQRKTINKNRFWSFIKSKKQDYTCIISLSTPFGVIMSDAVGKAWLLNNHLSSLFLLTVTVSPTITWSHPERGQYQSRHTSGNREAVEGS